MIDTIVKALQEVNTVKTEFYEKIKLLFLALIAQKQIVCIKTENKEICFHGYLRHLTQTYYEVYKGGLSIGFCSKNIIDVQSDLNIDPIDLDNMVTIIIKQEEE